MPGFSVKILKEELPDSKFLCEWCESLLRGALKASCGHFFCSSCVDNLLCVNPGRVSYCPRSNRPLFHIDTEFWPADAAFCDELHDLEVHCKECSWSGKLQNFEHHSGTCDFNSYHEKQREQFVREDNPCSQTEAYSDQVGGNCELLKPGPASSVAWQLNCVGTCDDNSNCTEERKQGNDRNHCSQIDQGNNNTLDNNLDLLKPEASNNVHHSGARDFNSYHEKQQELFIREDNPCSQTEAYSNQVGGNCELLKPGAASSVAWQLNCVGTCDVNSNCAEEQKQGNDRNYCGQIQGNNNMLDENLELLKPEASNNVLRYKECRAFPVVIDKCGKDNNHQEKKKEMNNTISLLPLSRKVLPTRNVVDIKEQITPLAKDVPLANADTEGASSYHSPKDQNVIRRLQFVEKKIAQHDLLFEENSQLKEEVQRLSSALSDVQRKLERIEVMFANSLFWQSDCFKALWETFEALKLEHSALRVEMDIPALRELHVKLTRTMRSIATMQEQIRNLEQRTLSHGNLLGDLSNAVTSLANEVGVLLSERIVGLDIERV